MPTFIDVSGEQKLPFSTVRAAIMDCVRFACGTFSSFDVRTFNNWKFETDAATLLGKVTPSLKITEGVNKGRIHCWMIGVGAFQIATDGSGNTPYIGSQSWDWDVDLDVWGFFENKGLEESHAFAEDEAEIVAATLWRNRDEIVASTAYLKRLTPLAFPIVESQPFAEGVNVIVAQGTMKALINRTITI